MTTEVDIKAELTIAWSIRDKLRAEGAKLRAEGDKLWAEKIIELCGNITVEWNYINDEKIEHVGQIVYSARYRCELGNGMTFEP